MRRLSSGLWALVGLAAAPAGWFLGGLLFGSFLARTIGALTLLALAFGLLARGPRFAATVALAIAAASAAAYTTGARSATPLLAWPVAALLIGLAAAYVSQRTRARVVALVAAPLLGGAGFILGAAAVMMTGFGLNAARVLEQFLAGGAAGFGLATLGGLRLLSHWTEGKAVAGGGQ
jgi:hypothetical protein